MWSGSDGARDNYTDRTGVQMLSNIPKTLGALRNSNSCAATMPTALGAAMERTTPAHIVHSSDCGVPCSTEATMDANLEPLLAFRGMSPEEITAIGRRRSNTSCALDNGHIKLGPIL